MLNKMQLIGRLGQDVELNYTPSGHAVAKFSVATTESWIDKNGQKQEKTEWHRVNVWGKLAELCNQYIRKGSQVYVEGQLETRSWDDKNGGGKRYSTEINAKKVTFLGSPSQNNGNNNNGNQNYNQSNNQSNYNNNQNQNQNNGQQGQNQNNRQNQQYNNQQNNQNNQQGQRQNQQNNGQNQQQQNNMNQQNNNNNNNNNRGAMDQSYNVSTDINFTADDIPF